MKRLLLVVLISFLFISCERYIPVINDGKMYEATYTFVNGKVLTLVYDTRNSNNCAKVYGVNQVIHLQLIDVRTNKRYIIRSEDVRSYTHREYRGK